ncbi:hypothetical protein CF54_31845 [Streptomyces sp. Tu 6176]|uniref:hypothetical protein n=1 Tax=Streptomyces sp. Tu 6176 TaxID=1470557 RepID=UPI00044ACDF3|nr:hypothetical protein [Streptomyces sp. Tu 6176]EYT79345.1 hypothetical protein CF54_31845 [Streptomyces sp. Tu 6176]
MTIHAVRLEAADSSVTVMSASQTVTDWTVRYFGQWWKATVMAGDSVCAGAVVLADVSASRYSDAALAVTSAPHTSTTYAKAQLLLTHDEKAGVITGASPSEELAYRSEPASGRMAVQGCAPEPVATATARLAREVMRGQLLRDGWAVLHASAVVHEGRVILTFGDKGAGKTTTALALASRRGFGLLANDRVFVRVNGDGGVDVLPWPSAAALGLGLLDGLGWFGITRERLQSGEALHPTQDPRVTEALLAGRREPLWEGGRELKAQIFPDQFPAWFSTPLATGGEAAALVFPRIERGAAPAVEEGVARRLGEADFMSGKTEDRYPDVFELARVDGGGSTEARQAVADRLVALPHHSVVLGWDVAANAGFLAKLTGCA